jgi:hypothetical protein
MIHDEKLAEKLRAYVRLDQPFGPVDAADVVEPDCYAALYDWNNKIFANILKGSDVLVGRRGSGKSSLLRSFLARNFLRDEFQSESGREFRDRFHIASKTLSKPPDIVVEIDTPFHVHELKKYCLRESPVPPVEMLAEWWRKRLWWLVGQKIKNSTCWSEVPEKIKHFVSNDDVAAIVGNEAQLKDALSPDQYISQLSLFLQNRGLRVVATFDNVEEHKFEDVSNAVLGGLIAATGKFIGAKHHPCLDVKLCLPAELFRKIEKLTFRPDKDLHKIQYLHWNAAELLHLAARRLTVYLSLWNPDEYDLIKDTRLTSRVALMKFWHRYLPETITNSVGVDENTITYILRHTQLLPRQLISILNAICDRFRGEGDELFGRKFTSQEIVKGIEDTERNNIQAVLYMFQRIYPEIDELLHKVMPRLSREFNYGRLQSVWNSSAKSYMSQRDMPEFISFWRMMFSIGAIGLKVEEESTPDYSVARFEFNTKYILSISDKDKLCVHPMFSRIYNVERDGCPKLVLPRGTDFRIDREQI